LSLIACGSIHQGHERFISVMTLEEDKRFLCFWLLYCARDFFRFANGAGCLDIGQFLLHGDHFFLSAFSSKFYSKMLLPGEEGVKLTCFMSKATSIPEANHSQYYSPVKALLKFDR